MPPLSRNPIPFARCGAAAASLIGMCLVGCQREKNLVAGRYAVSDAEYSRDLYELRRDFRNDATFTEAHSLNHCLMMEMQGRWEQRNAELHLAYSALRQRANCRQDLPDFAADTAALTIPIRHVGTDGFESFMTASGGKPEKWLQWVRAEAQ